jgi:hypothetical protein
VHLTVQKPHCFTETLPISRLNDFPWGNLLTKKRELFQELPPTSPSSFALPRLQPEAALSHGRDGNINPFPFRSGRLPVERFDQKHLNDVINHLPLCCELPLRLGPPDPRSTAVHTEPFSTSVFKVLT